MLSWKPFQAEGIPNKPTIRRRPNNSKTILKVRLGVYPLVGLLLLLIYADIVPVMPHVSFPIAMIYPSSRQEPTPDSILIQARVSSDEGFAERTRIRIHAVGSIGDGFAKNVSNIQFLFKGAYFEMYLEPHVVGPQPSLEGEPAAGVYLFITKIAPPEGLEGVSPNAIFLDSREDALVQWLTEGYYYPTLVIVFKNGNQTI